MANSTFDPGTLNELRAAWEYCARLAARAAGVGSLLDYDEPTVVTLADAVGIPHAEMRTLVRRGRSINDAGGPAPNFHRTVA